MRGLLQYMDTCLQERRLEMKALLALALMLALGNTAAAGPLGVNMGEPIKPDKGWDDYGRGFEFRPYEGPFSFKPENILIEGTQKSGACSLSVRFDNHEVLKDLWTRLTIKYGKPSISGSKHRRWVLSENPDKIVNIYLDNRMLYYQFENHQECEKAKEAAKKIEEAAEKAKSKRMDAEL